VGLGVTEFAPQGKAAEEIRELWRWVSQQIMAELVDHAQTAIKAAG
jgi:chromosome partitioning protein